MHIRPTGRLAEMLAARPDLLKGFELDERELDVHAHEIARNQPRLAADEQKALAIYTTLFHPNSKGNTPALAEMPHIDGQALHHTRAMNAQLKDSAATRAAVIAATEDATKTLIGALTGATAEAAERIVQANADAHAVLARGVQIFANRAAEQADHQLAELRATKIANDENFKATVLISQDAAQAHSIAAMQTRASIDVVSTTLDDVRNILVQTAAERRAADEAEADRLVILESNREHDARQRHQIEDAARTAAADRAEAAAEERARRARLQAWIQIGILIALLLAMFAPHAHAQSTVAPVTTASTAGSALTSFVSSAASTNATSVKAAAGNVYTIRAINTTATLYYLRMYNLAAAPTCSSATGFVESIPIPASATGAGVAITQYPQGYTTGIGYCLTGGGSSTDNTSAATGVFITVLYK